MSLVAEAERFLDSRLWWRRAIALRALGLLQSRDHTGRIVAALDDVNIDVRAAALDALADLPRSASLPALVVRLLDPTLPYGRRVDALSAFGAAAEPLLVELSTLDTIHHVAYARALSVCGTAASRELLCEWTTDPTSEVRAAAFVALAHVGLDDRCVELAIRALDVDVPVVRAAAARALHGWSRRAGHRLPPDTASRRHLGGGRRGGANAAVDGAGGSGGAAGVRAAHRSRRPAGAADAWEAHAAC
jgi:HEAT repeat protein